MIKIGNLMKFARWFLYINTITMLARLLLLALVASSYAGCREEQKIFDPAKIVTEWALVRNVSAEEPHFRASITLINNGDTDIDVDGWKLYFSLRYHGYDLTSQSTEIDLKHVSGDLFYLKTTEDFSGLKPGESITMDYTGKRRIANFQDVPTGLFWVNKKASTMAVRLDNPTVATDKSMEELPAVDAAGIFEKNKIISDIPVEQLPGVFPTPVSFTKKATGITLDQKTTIAAIDDFQAEATYLADELEKVLGHKLKVETGKSSGVIQFLRTDLPAEGYHLMVNNGQVIIEAGDNAGIFYGIQSLKTLTG